MRLIFIPIFIFITFLSHAQDWDSIIKGNKAWLVERDNEFERNEAGKDEPFYTNPLLLNGKPIDYNYFNLQTKGELSVVKGNPNSTERTEIPFTIDLRRNGIIINPSFEPLFEKVLMSFYVQDILKYAQRNDHLIITPVKKEHYKAKRVLNLIP